MRTFTQVGTLIVAFATSLVASFETSANSEEGGEARTQKTYRTNLTVEQLDQAYRKNPRDPEKRLQFADGLLLRSQKNQESWKSRLAKQDLKNVLKLTEDMSVSPCSTASMRAYALINLSCLSRLHDEDLIAAEQYASAALKLTDQCESTESMVCSHGLAFNALAEIAAKYSHSAEAIELECKAMETLNRCLEEYPEMREAAIAKVRVQWNIDTLQADKANTNYGIKKPEERFEKTIATCDSLLEKFPDCAVIAFIKAECQTSNALSKSLRNVSADKRTQIDAINSAFAPAFDTLRTLEIRLAGSDEATRDRLLIERAKVHRQKADALKMTSPQLGLIETGESLRILELVDSARKRSPLTLSERLFTLETAGNLTEEDNPNEARRYYLRALKCYQELSPQDRRLLKLFQTHLKKRLLET